MKLKYKFFLILSFVSLMVAGSLLYITSNSFVKDKENRIYENHNVIAFNIADKLNLYFKMLSLNLSGTDKANLTSLNEILAVAHKKNDQLVFDIPGQDLAPVVKIMIIFQ